jgi:hypothetical protein
MASLHFTSCYCKDSLHYIYISTSLPQPVVSGVSVLELCKFYLFFVRAKCLAHLTVLQIAFAKVCKIWTSTSFNILQPSLSSSFVSINTFILEVFTCIRRVTNFPSCGLCTEATQLHNLQGISMLRLCGWTAVHVRLHASVLCALMDLLPAHTVCSRTLQMCLSLVCLTTFCQWLRLSIASIESVINEWWIGMDVDGGTNLRYYPGIYLEVLNITSKNLSQDTLFPNQDFNARPPEYEAGVLTTHPRRFVCTDVQSRCWSGRKKYMKILRCIVSYKLNKVSDVFTAW